MAFMAARLAQKQKSSIPPSLWQCSHCERVYSNDAMRKLPAVKAVEWQYGYVPVCKCGKRFYLDKWHLHDSARTYFGGVLQNVELNTVHLELNHHFSAGPHIWYETMLFPSRTYSDFRQRHSTRAEAVVEHQRILAILRRELLGVDLL